MTGLVSLAVVAMLLADPPGQPAPLPPLPLAPVPLAPAPLAAPVAAPAPIAAPRPTGTAEIGLCSWTATRDSAGPKEDESNLTLGRLLFSRVDVRCEDVSMRDALRGLADTLGINITPRYEYGFEADTPVNLELKDVDGRTALEAILSQANSDANWQLHRGLVDIGLRPYLARPGARRTKAYEVIDLTFEAPYYAHPGIRLQADGQQVFHDPSPELSRRRTPIEVAADLVQTIANQVEPEAWQPLPPGDGSDGTAGPQPYLASPEYRNASGTADRNFDPLIGPIFVRGKWAQIDYSKQTGSLVVTAPDFVHRGIAGYPEPLPPVVRLSAKHAGN